jgi:hypothetical protein
MLTSCAYQTDNLSVSSLGNLILKLVSRLICFQRLSIPNVATRQCSRWPQSIHQRFVRPGPLVLGVDLLKFPNVRTGYKPNCLTTFWTQLAYHFNRRTAEPLEGAPPPGCDEPTSRCQTAPSMWTIGRYKPVIPRVTFIRVRCRSHVHST